MASFKILRFKSLIRLSRSSGAFILEEFGDDPVLAPRTNQSPADPLLVYHSSYFVEEPSCPQSIQNQSNNKLSLEIKKESSKESDCPFIDSENDVENDFTLQELLGQGGFGKVFVAINKSSRQRLAVKIVEVDENAEDEAIHILDEIEMLSRLKHFNIVNFVSCGRDEHRIFVFMELMQGVSDNYFDFSYIPFFNLGFTRISYQAKWSS